MSDDGRRLGGLRAIQHLRAPSDPDPTPPRGSRIHGSPPPLATLLVPRNRTVATTGQLTSSNRRQGALLDARRQLCSCVSGRGGVDLVEVGASVESARPSSASAHVSRAKGVGLVEAGPAGPGSGPRAVVRRLANHAPRQRTLGDGIDLRGQSARVATAPRGDGCSTGRYVLSRRARATAVRQALPTAPGTLTIRTSRWCLWDGAYSKAT